MGALATAGPSPLWYLNRGAGLVALVLLTFSVVLGIVDQRRWQAKSWPRFVVDGLHRNVSLLVLVILAVHIGTSVADSFAPIGLKDAVVPFLAPYRPIWLGLGALAFDLLLAVAVTSVLRARLGYRAWRYIHWLAYAAWPVAVVHGLGTGTDAKSAWMLSLTGACVALVCVATWIRVVGGSPRLTGQHKAALAALIVGPVALMVWLPRGPLGSAWAVRAGTPKQILARGSASKASAPVAAALPVPFRARVRGSLHRGQRPSGLATIDLAMKFRDRVNSSIDVLLEGNPTGAGGIEMSRSGVALGPASSPQMYEGQVVALTGTNVEAVAKDSSGRSLRINLALTIDTNTDHVGGTIAVSNGGSAQ